MAIAVDLNFPGATADQYDEAVKLLVTAPGYPACRGHSLSLGSGHE